MMTIRCCMTRNQDAMPMRKLLRPLKKVREENMQELQIAPVLNRLRSLLVYE